MRTPDSALGCLILLRHGESSANAEGLFTGRWDVPLSKHGRQQAHRAARLLLDAFALPDLVVTSPMLRATQTLEIILEEMGRPDLAQLVSPELTERAYGVLTGLRKTGVSHIFGAEQAGHWRRSMTGRPPRPGDLIDKAHSGELELVFDVGRLLSDVPAEARAAAETSESLVDVVVRVGRWLEAVLAPQLQSRKSVLVVAHGNSLRALVSLLDALDASETERLNIPTGEPLVYAVSGHGVPVSGSGRYLDPDSAQEAALAVASEGGT
jgi:2,3-bisphosphoglycerate-dependent phosphoglycerate mutase